MVTMAPTRLHVTIEAACRVLKLWSLESGAEILCFGGLTDSVTSAAVTRDFSPVLNVRWGSPLGKLAQQPHFGHFPIAQDGVGRNL